jgi:biotin transporter BioY
MTLPDFAESVASSLLAAWIVSHSSYWRLLNRHLLSIVLIVLMMWGWTIYWIFLNASGTHMLPQPEGWAIAVLFFLVSVFLTYFVAVIFALAWRKNLSKPSKGE